MVHQLKITIEVLTFTEARGAIDGWTTERTGSLKLSKNVVLKLTNILLEGRILNHVNHQLESFVDHRRHYQQLITLLRSEFDRICQNNTQVCYKRYLQDLTNLADGDLRAYKRLLLMPGSPFGNKKQAFKNLVQTFEQAAARQVIALKSLIQAKMFEF